MRSQREQTGTDAEVEAAIRWVRQQERCRAMRWEGEREGVRWSARLNGYGGIEIRRANGIDNEEITIPSSLAESFVGFIAQLYPDAAAVEDAEAPKREVTPARRPPRHCQDGGDFHGRRDANGYCVDCGTRLPPGPPASPPPPSPNVG